MLTSFIHHGFLIPYQQTTQDYAVVVNNPPPFVKDPDEYFNFFKKFGDIAFITTCLNNGLLLKSLSRRRELRATLKSTPEGAYFNHYAFPLSFQSHPLLPFSLIIPLSIITS